MCAASATAAAVVMRATPLQAPLYGRRGGKTTSPNWWPANSPHGAGLELNGKKGPWTQCAAGLNFADGLVLALAVKIIKPRRCSKDAQDHPATYWTLQFGEGADCTSNLQLACTPAVQTG